MSRIISSKPSGVISQDLSINQLNWDSPEHLAIGQLSAEKLFNTVAIDPGVCMKALPKQKHSWSFNGVEFSDPLRPGRCMDSEQFLNRRLFNDALLIVHQGKTVYESYRNGMDENDRHVIHSCTKSLISILVQQAVERKLFNPLEKITHYIPELKKLSAWQGVTLQHVWDMQAGLDYSEDYTDPNAHYWSYARSAGYYPPKHGEKLLGVKEWIRQNLTRRADNPGAKFSYNSCLTNVLGMALEHVYHSSLIDIFEQNFYSHIGAESEAYFNTDHLGFPIAEGQLSLTLRDFARCSWPLMNAGQSLTGRQLFSADFPAVITLKSKFLQKIYQDGQVDRVFSQGQYSHQYWGIDTEQSQFAMLGIHGQFSWFDLEQDLFAVGFGSFPQQDGELMMVCLSELWRNISMLAKHSS